MRNALACVLAVVLPAASAGAPVFSSGPGRTHLIELYTSEGCSSCPPAEAWLGGLRDDAGLWRDFVPVAFHVNYWDRLGWPDRFARREFTDRQRAYADAWRARTVYTPGVVLDGAEWRDWRRAGVPARGREAAGKIVVEVSDGRVRVSYTPAPEAVGAAGSHDVNVAMLGGGIVSAVKAGENEGRTLRHEFVALGLARAPLADGRAELRLPAGEVAGVNRRALAVWVTRRGELAPLQATGGWLD